MRRRPPSPRLLPNTAQVLRVAFGRDSGSGRRATAAAPGPAIRCAIQGASADDVPEHSREQGVEYLTAKFYRDPGVRVRDEVLDDLGRVLVVTGVRGSSGGAGRTWPVDLEYRPPAGA